jgi:aspartyl-tRNA(Asn)/glutamyl-tRNA(Gln) amidotransferase subunit B
MARFETVIGLEIHAELQTASKMFCSCPVVDTTRAAPNSAVCPVCSGMPGALPVLNRRAVDYALRVALALHCTVAPTSVFARKNYFYPDLPKGYQISQFEQPLARNGLLDIQTSTGDKRIRIRRLHLEEDAGKLTHRNQNSSPYTLIDLNRAGVPLLEIVTEPDLRSAEEVRAFAVVLRSILRYLEVNSGDMDKGLIRIEPNISLRVAGSDELGTRAEIKNLNSFRSLERAVAYEIGRQRDLLSSGQLISQETMGWDESRQVTFPQRSKEEAHDYRYFPEPDLPPLYIEPQWISKIQSGLPELPKEKADRFQNVYGLNHYDSLLLADDRSLADYFEKVIAYPRVDPKSAVNWITGELFNLMNQSGIDILHIAISPLQLAELLQLVGGGEINHTSAKAVLAEMFATGGNPAEILASQGLRQISDRSHVSELVQTVLADHPEAVESYFAGKETVFNFLFGQVMRAAGGTANPEVVRHELDRQLSEPKESDPA